MGRSQIYSTARGKAGKRGSTLWLLIYNRNITLIPINNLQTYLRFIAVKSRQMYTFIKFSITLQRFSNTQQLNQTPLEMKDYMDIYPCGVCNMFSVFLQSILEELSSQIYESTFNSPVQRATVSGMTEPWQDPLQVTLVTTNMGYSLCSYQSCPREKSM